MSRVPTTLAALALAAALAACGGSSNSGSSGSGNGGGGGTTPPPNPCTTAGVTEIQAIGSVAAGAPAPNKKVLIDGDPRGRLYESLWIHRDAEERRRAGARPTAAVQQPSATSPAPVAEDSGDIAIVQDTGDIILPANLFDLHNVGFRFTRNGSSYALTKIDGTFRTALGSAVTLGDDDSVQVNSAFAFPFYGTGQTNVFVNSDGNITFGEEDKASTERSVSRLLTGPPRVAPFLADLDPTTGGKIFVNAASDQYTVTWCAVRGFDSTKTVTVQATLLPDGSVEFKFGDATTLGDAVVGLSPGHTGDFTTVDLSTTAGVTSSGAIGERFSQSSSLDSQAAALKFYATGHADNFDQILLWTDQRIIRDAFSYELTVANEVRGIGQDIYDLSGSYGSAGRLRSMVVMDFIGKFPDDPAQKFLGENNTLSVMGQEVGHRWLAYVNFRDHTGTKSDALLGRDLAHWSFFLDSDASVMEGNDIQDLGGGSFKTVDAVKRYSRLDQYAMGLVAPSDVPPFFYVESPVSTHVRDDAPQIGVSFTGTRRDVLIDDVIAIEGPRAPAFPNTPRVHRQAFVYVATSGHTVDSTLLAKVDRFRAQWEPFFLQATDGRMSAVTRLR
jgi:hypothetical protein